MPSPTAALSTQRPDIAVSFEAFDLEADHQNYIGHRVFPVIDVAKQAGNYGTIPLDQLLQQRDTMRAPGSGYARGKFTFTPATYSCNEHGAEEPIDDRESNMYSDYFDAELVAARRAYNSVLRNAEDRIASAVFDTTVWTGGTLTAAGAVAWSTVATSTPLVDVETAVSNVYTNSGLWPNAIIMNRKTWRNLRRSQSIIDLVKYSGFMDTRAGNITTEAVAQCFDLDYVLVAGGSKNSAKEGQTAAAAQVWADGTAMVCKVATTQDFREPCIGRTFHWSEDGSEIDGRFESYRDEPVRSDVIRVRHDVAEVVLYKQAGFLITGL